MSNVQKKTVIYPFCKIYKGDVISNSSITSHLSQSTREIVRGIVDDDVIYKRHGHGIFTKEGDFYYNGQFRHNKKHGKGYIIYENNSRYSGDWVNDRPYGRGEIIWPNGIEYEGEVKANTGNPTKDLAVADGRGVLTYPDRMTRNGIFSNNRQISGEKWYSLTNDLFNGTFNDDMDNFHKKGQLDIFNYYVYDGNFVNDMFDGKGIITYKNGDKYSGIFKRGFFDGTGIFYDAVNKREYRGNWKNGNMLINHNIRYIDLSRRGKSFTTLKKINLTELRKEADKNPSSNIFRPAPNTLFYPGSYILDYTYSIPDKIEEFKKLKKTNSHEYRNKPVAYYTIRAHGGYSHGETKIFLKNDISSLQSIIEEHISNAELSGEKMTPENAMFLKEQKKDLELLKKRYQKLKGRNPYEGEQDTFIVPEGIRLVFLSKSLTSIPADTDKFLFKPEFYTNSLTNRASYESISPITLFSTIKNNPNGSVSKIDICKFLNNKTLPSKFTTNYINWRISNRGQIRKNLDLFHYTRTNPLDEIGKLLNSCSNSIYDSGMECSNLELTWRAAIGSRAENKTRVKIGIYPLPSDSLIKEAQNPKIFVKGMEKAFKHFEQNKSFQGGFMPLDPSMTNDDYLKGHVNYTNDAESMWDIYGDTTSQLKDFVQQLPRGTREHPCVYFMNTCRIVMSDSSSSDIDRDVVISLRTHSDRVQGAYDKV